MTRSISNSLGKNSITIRWSLSISARPREPSPVGDATLLNFRGRSARGLYNHNRCRSLSHVRRSTIQQLRYDKVSTSLSSIIDRGGGLTSTSPSSVQLIAQEACSSHNSTLRRLNEYTSLGERLQRSPKVTRLINTNTLCEPRHLAEVIRRRKRPGNVLLSVDPNIDGLYISTRKETILRRARLGNTIDLSDDAVISRITAENIGPVFEFVLLVLPAAQTHGGDDAVGYLAGAGVDVHSVQGNRGPGVGSETDELTRVNFHQQNTYCT